MVKRIKKIKRKVIFGIIFVYSTIFKVEPASCQFQGVNGFVNRPIVCRRMGVERGSREAFNLGKELEIFSDQNRNDEFNVGHYSFSNKQLQKKFKHAKVFGIDGNFNKKNLELFKSEIIQHLRDSKTKLIKGVFRNNEVFHHFNAETKINMMFYRDNKQFLSCWKLNEKQIEHMEKDGKI